MAYAQDAIRFSLILQTVQKTSCPFENGTCGLHFFGSIGSGPADQFKDVFRNMFKPETFISPEPHFYKPVIDPEACNACGLCINMCKFDALSKKEEA